MMCSRNVKTYVSLNSTIWPTHWDMILTFKSSNTNLTESTSSSLDRSPMHKWLKTVDNHPRYLNNDEKATALMRTSMILVGRSL
jgi:hypothetical protein